jgi:hypothetical protein
VQRFCFLENLQVFHELWGGGAPLLFSQEYQNKLLTSGPSLRVSSEGS